MKEKELRLALVCYGGVSLAVYIHGVTKELHKLIRASRAYHSVLDLVDRSQSDYRTLSTEDEDEIDTEAVYFEFLKEIGQDLDLRVFVDVIAGASAGGINGVMLARALAHDLSLESHRDMWLSQGDVTALLDQEAVAGKWSKAFLRPLFWDINDRWLKKIAPDSEMRNKLSLFMRSRWFQPPFSGERMSDMLLDACRSMGEPTEDGSLLPLGHRLDLFVSVTDFHGYAQDIPLHDPATVREREHRHILRFHATRHVDVPYVTHFDNEHLPGLAFAARATSSFPGAFPPAQITEIDRLLTKRGEDWPYREDFIDRNFKQMINAGANPLMSSFIDGSVLNNKPFAEAIDALRDRPAYREVDRRIIYVDPDPESGELERAGAPPGFFQTIRASLSDIPRNEPVRDELADINTLSQQAHLYRQVVKATRPQILRAVDDILDGHPEAAPNSAQLGALRSVANGKAAADAGYAYEGYIQVKVLSVLNWLSKIVADLAPGIAHPNERLALTRSIERWAETREIFPVKIEPGVDETDHTTQTAPWIGFLRHFDVEFRMRRLRFVIRRLNELYETLDHDAEGVDCRGLDEFKRILYAELERLSSRCFCSFFEQKLHEEAGRILNESGGNATSEQLQPILGQIEKALSLLEIDSHLDETFSIMSVNYLPEPARKELLLSYLAFPFFDVLTFPLLKWQQVDDIDTVLVDRISPEDCSLLADETGKTLLRGRELGHFGAFFSRAAREHDYLWGRLHAADRLVDIVADSASSAMMAEPMDILKIKGALFRAILKQESRHLTKSGALISDIALRVGTTDRATADS